MAGRIDWRFFVIVLAFVNFIDSHPFSSNNQQLTYTNTMTEVSNKMAARILISQCSFDRSNVLFSPWELMNVIVALYEGACEQSSLQIAQACQLPQQDYIIRDGFKDINRQMQMCCTKMAFPVASLSFNRENIPISSQYANSLNSFGSVAGFAPHTFLTLPQNPQVTAQAHGAGTMEQVPKNPETFYHSQIHSNGNIYQEGASFAYATHGQGQHIQNPQMVTLTHTVPAATGTMGTDSLQKNQVAFDHSHTGISGTAFQHGIPMSTVTQAQPIQNPQVVNYSHSTTGIVGTDSLKKNQQGSRFNGNIFQHEAAIATATYGQGHPIQNPQMVTFTHITPPATTGTMGTDSLRKNQVVFDHSHTGITGTVFRNGIPMSTVTNSQLIQNPQVVTYSHSTTGTMGTDSLKKNQQGSGFNGNIFQHGATIATATHGQGHPIQNPQMVTFTHITPSAKTGTMGTDSLRKNQVAYDHSHTGITGTVFQGEIPMSTVTNSQPIQNPQVVTYSHSTTGTMGTDSLKNNPPTFVHSQTGSSGMQTHSQQSGTDFAGTITSHVDSTPIQPSDTNFNGNLQPLGAPPVVTYIQTGPFTPDFNGNILPQEYHPFPTAPPPVAYNPPCETEIVEKFTSNATTTLANSTETTVTKKCNKCSQRNKRFASLISFKFSNSFLLDKILNCCSAPRLRSNFNLFKSTQNPFAAAKYNNFVSLEMYNYHSSFGISVMEINLPTPETSLVILLPDAGVDSQFAISSLLQSESLNEIRRKLQPTWIQARIPDFKIRKITNLGQDLVKMGIADIFEAKRANFCKMTNGHGGIFVREIQQTNEITIIGLKPSKPAQYALHPSSPLQYFNADRPFYFFVMQKQVNMAILAGRVSNPLY